ncbi:MAG TPA: hypothetical protein VF375_08990 [Candidatus Limnocylindrales bacterium]
MPFANSVLQLVRAGVRGQSRDSSDEPVRADLAVAAEPAVEAKEAEPVVTAEFQAAELDTDADLEPSYYEPGLGDLEAAVALVAGGLANRVVLTGFPSWPGLLWRAYQLAESAGVLILPTVVRPGGKVDIVITREIATND